VEKVYFSSLSFLTFVQKPRISPTDNMDILGTTLHNFTYNSPKPVEGVAFGLGSEVKIGLLVAASVLFTDNAVYSAIVIRFVTWMEHLRTVQDL
jgi:hypothetical protein